MKLSFWLLDVNHEVSEHKPEMWIWGMDSHGKRVLILDRNFLAYFYAVINEGENPQTARAGAEMIVSRRSPEDAARFVQKFIEDLRARKLPFRDLIIWKTLTKRVEDYAVRAPHVMAAKVLLKEGWDLSMGDKIGYVILAGPGKLYEKARPHVLASYGEVDIEYYVSKQVLPVASRILSMFGITEDKLLPVKTTETTLGECA